MRFQRFIVRFCVIFTLVPVCFAITTPQDLRVAFDDLAALESQSSSLGADTQAFSEKVLTLRHRLRDYALGSFIDAAARADSLDALPKLARQRIEEANLPLSGFAPWMPQNQKAFASIEIVPVRGTADWIGAKVSISLPCGTDQSLYFLQILPADTGRAGFTATFRLASEMPLNSLLDAPLDFSFATWISEDRQTFRLATVAATGGCSSYWHPMSMQILEPGEQSYRPLRLFERVRTAFLGTMVRPVVKPVANGFRFEYQTQFFLDLDRHNRNGETLVEFDGNEVRLRPPATADPAEFLDEWVSSTWAESRQWTAGFRTASLREWHRALAGRNRNRAVTELVGVGECLDSSIAWVQIDRGESPSRSSSIYCLLRKATPGFQVDRFAEDLPDSCRSTRKATSDAAN